MSFVPAPSLPALLASGEPATAKAYQATLDAIVSGATPVGRLLTEGAVADALGMSRTPVREAFLRLEREGLLELYPKRGAVVTAADDPEMRDLLETREMFEVAAVCWLAERGVPDGLAATLEGALARQRGADDALAFARADRALHEAIVAAGGNPIALALFEQTGPRLLRHWHRFAVSAGARARLLAEHRRLVERVLAADADGFRTLLREHLGGAHDS